MTSITVLVTCVGGRLIYDILRGMREAEDFTANIIGVDADPEAHGRLLCDRFEVFPMAADEPEAYLSRIKALHLEVGLDVILTLSEGETRLLAEHRDELMDLGMKLSVSSLDTVHTMTDKLKMLERITERGIHSTPFLAVDSERDFDHALDQLGYGERKIVVKPRQGAGSRGVMIVDKNALGYEKLLPNRFCGTGTRDDIVAAMQGEGVSFEGLIAVPHVGGGVYDVDCIADHGELVDFSARLRQLRNPLWPTSTGHKIDLNPHVKQYAAQLCEAFGVHGAADFDIALDDDNRPVLFDAGARFSGSVGGSLAAGGDFPSQLVRVLTGLPRMPMNIRDGVVLRPYITMSEVPAKNETDLL